MPNLDLPFKLLNLFVQRLEVLNQSLNKLAERDWQLASRTFDYAREFRRNVGNPPAAQSNQTQQAALGSDGLSCPSLYEPLTRTMQGQDSLLLNIFDGYKPHRWAGHSLADGLGIGCIILVAPDIGFDELWGHKPNGMAPRFKLAGPVVRTATRFHTDQARR